jgi:hypothetical protein
MSKQLQYLATMLTRDLILLRNQNMRLNLIEKAIIWNFEYHGRLMNHELKPERGNVLINIKK